MLQQTLSLFGRGFVIAALVPTALATTVILLVLGRSADLQGAVGALTGGGTATLTYTTIVGIVAVILVAYVVHGIRPLLHGLLRGRWPRPLEWLPRRLQLRGFARLQAEQDLCDARLTDLAWVARGMVRAGYDPRPLRAAHLAAPLFDGSGRHRMLVVARRDLTRFRRGLDVARLERLVAYARRLTASVEQGGAFPGDTRHTEAGIRDLLAELRRSLYKNPDAPEEDRKLKGDTGRVYDVAKARAERLYRECFTDLAERFPQERSRIMATRLGNIAMVQQEYPLKRYGIALGELWPRLVLVLPDKTTKALEDSQIYLDFCVITASLAGATLLFVGGWDGYTAIRPC